jgi:chromosome segregation ATPase
LTSIADPGALLEYLNQITLKGDMVVDELKRVSTERDDYKKKLEEAEKSAKDAWDEVAGLKKQKEEQSETASLVNGTPGRASMDISSASDDPLGETQKNNLSPVASPKTRTPSLVSMFSPKLKSSKSPPPKEESEEFFSYDSEIPRLELELKEAREEVVDLKSQLTKVKGDLSVARESTEGMVQSLESATRELHALRDGRDKHEGEILDLRQKHDGELSVLREKHVEEIGRLNDDLKTSIEAANTYQTLHKNEVDSIQDEIKKTRLTVSELEAQKAENEKTINSANEEKLQVEKKVGTLNGLVDNLKKQLKDAEAKIGSLQTEIDERKAAADIKLETKTDPKNEEQISSEIPDDVLKHEEETVKAEPQTADGATSSKKKNKQVILISSINRQRRKKQLPQ